MRRDRKNPHASGKTATTKVAPSAHQAQASLAAERYRDAIEQFKTLSRTDPPEIWREGLAAAYRGRALELEAKGMAKEALTIWDNRRQACPGLGPDPRHLALLLRLGQSEAALTGYRSLLADGESPALAEVRGHFAAHFLTEELPPGFASDPAFAADPLLRDANTARAALAAWCAGDDDTAAGQLKAIPFRSPYRDLTTLLKVLLTWETDPIASEKLLARVTADSPFAPLAAALRLGLLPDEELLPALSKASQPSRDFVMSLRGWPERRRQLWRETQRLGDPPDPGQMVVLLRRYRQCFSERWWHHMLRALGIALYPRKAPAALSQELNDFDHALLGTLIDEREFPPPDVYTFWTEVKDLIALPGHPPAPGSPDALRIALIQRRLADRLGLLQSTMRRMIEHELAESLELDPDYLPGYLLLLRHYRTQGSLALARPLMERILQRWPEDAEALNEALELAIAGDAFKKAAGLAKRILDRDPINRRARHSLFRAHLAHARKQMKRDRHDLAHKELEQADRWAEGAEHQVRVELLRGLSQHLLGKPDRAALQLACNRLGGGIAGRLTLALEAEGLGFSPQHFLQGIGLTPIPKPVREDLLAYCRILRTLLEQEDKVQDRRLARVAQPFHGALRQAARLPLEAPDYETVCETLRLAGLAELRLEFAKAALRRWPNRPLFVLHRYEAQTNLPAPGSRFLHDLRPLEDALTQARAEGDQRTTHRLLELLKEQSPFSFDPGFSPFGDLDDFGDDEDDLYPDEDLALDPKAAAEIANMDPEFLLRLFKMALGPEFKQVEKLFGKDVPAGIRRMLTNGEFSGLPPEVIQILSQLAGLPPPPPPSRSPATPPPRPGLQPKPKPGPRAGKAGLKPTEKAGELSVSDGQSTPTRSGPPPGSPGSGTTPGEASPDASLGTSGSDRAGPGAKPTSSQLDLF
jgi:tetratricopeptide (TPR) repeat protein